jgi:hypothetical protein
VGREIVRMTDYEIRARLNFDIEPELHERFTNAVPHGMRSTIVRVVLWQLTEAIEQEGLVIAGLILDNKLKLFGRT